MAVDKGTTLGGSVEIVVQGLAAGRGMVRQLDYVFPLDDAFNTAYVHDLGCTASTELQRKKVKLKGDGGDRVHWTLFAKQLSPKKGTEKYCW